MISEGGTEYGHMVTIARARSPWGPYEACPRNPILTHRDTPLSQPIQATGHADLVQDAEGGWWMVFLGIRPQGGYYWHHLGRETFLAPVRWDAQGWPVVNEGKPIALDMSARGLPAAPVPVPPVRDDFSAPALGPAWTFLRNPEPQNYSTTERPGWLTLHPAGAWLSADKGFSPTFVARRQQHLRARIATRIDFQPRHDHDEAGLVLYRSPNARYELGVRSGKGGSREIFLRQIVGADVSAETGGARLSIGQTGPVILQIDAEPTRYTFSWAYAPGPSEGPAPGLTRLGEAETRLLATEVTGGFTGTVVGLFVEENINHPNPPPAAFDWFDYEGK